jgi:uncharacterized membrane protein (UPF0127 family)
MKFKFDAVFLDKKNKIRCIEENIPPWWWAKFCFSAYSVVELPAGIVSETGTAVGDKLEFIPE